MKFQSLPSIFVYVLVFIAINALFVLNEQTNLLIDSEFKLILGERFDENPIWVSLSQTLFDSFSEQAFLWRLTTMISIVISILVSFRIGKRLFGKDSLQWAMIIMTCSIFLLFYARFYALDNLYFALQMPLALLLISFIKTRNKKDLVIILPLALLCLSLDWYKTFIFLSMFGIGTYIFLYQTNKALKYTYLIAAFLLAIFNYFFIGSTLFNSMFLFQAANLQLHVFIGILILGFLPFIGFVIAGLVSLPVQVSRKDEFSIWMFLLLIPALLSFSMLPVFVISMLVGKHSLAFASERYKYKGLVKTIFLVHLTLILVGGIVALIWAFLEYRGAGFRAGLGLCSIYWILGFSTVVGLYGGNMKYYLRAPLLAGPLFILFFWVLAYQMNPNSLGLTNTALIGPENTEWSAYITDPLLKSNLDFLDEKGKLKNIEIYNGNLDITKLQLPALLDESSFKQLEASLDESFSIEQKTYFSGAKLKSYFLVTINEES
jgi:hypothetical protein